MLNDQMPPGVFQMLGQGDPCNQLAQQQAAMNRWAALQRLSAGFGAPASVRLTIIDQMQREVEEWLEDWEI